MTKDTRCVCGHAKAQHIYEEGACRPGFVCEHECGRFTLASQDLGIEIDEIGTKVDSFDPGPQTLPKDSRTLKLGPDHEVGVCDQCLVYGDSTAKLVKRYLDTDNIYVCARHNRDFKHQDED